MTMASMAYFALNQRNGNDNGNNYNRNGVKILKIHVYVCNFTVNESTHDK